MPRAPITIYLVRHGEVDFDRVGDWTVDQINRYATGRMQTGLSERGRRQAEWVAGHFERLGITRIYTSTFRRARETALPLAERLDLKPTARAALGELNPGAIADEGLPRFLLELFARQSVQDAGGAPWGLREWMPATLERQVRAGVTQVLNVNHLVEWLRGRTTGGEGVREGFDRIGGALRAITRANPEGRVVVFTHGYFILLSMLHSIATWPPGARATFGRVLTVPHGSITVLERNRLGRLALARAAESRHLDGLE